MQTRKLLTVLGLLLVIPAASLKADDTLATLGAGGLVPVKSTQIVMESEYLQISVHKITVRYVFRNNTNKDIKALIEFPLPDLDSVTLNYESLNLPREAQQNFVDFKISSGGKPIPAKLEDRAFLKGKDVTARLTAAGLPVRIRQSEEPLTVLVENLKPAERRQLESEGLIQRGDTQPVDWLAGWTERVKFYWTQRFPAHGNVELVQTYLPVVGGSYIPGSGDVSDILKTHCGGPEDRRRILLGRNLVTVGPDGGIVWFERNIDFILKTANNWSGPIRRFRLVVLSDSPRDIVLTCMPGLKRLGPTRYQLTRTNFRPTTDLNLDILQLAQH